jgi:hypothetical protein
MNILMSDSFSNFLPSSRVHIFIRCPEFRARVLKILMGFSASHVKFHPAVNFHHEYYIDLPVKVLQKA